MSKEDKEKHYFEDQPAECQDFSCGSAPLGCANKEFCPKNDQSSEPEELYDEEDYSYEDDEEPEWDEDGYWEIGIDEGE